MLQRIGIHRTLWLLIAGTTVIAALVGIVVPGIYDGLVSNKVLAGVIAQDIVALGAAGVLLLVALRDKRDDDETGATSQTTRGQIIALGIVGFLFYAYGIYAIERLFNAFYLVYLAIFALCTYALVFALVDLDRSLAARAQLPNRLRIGGIVLLIMNPLIFYPLWLGQLIPLMMSGEKIEFYYSIYIIDLCLIMPAFLLLTRKLVKKDGIGYLLTPVLLILGIGILAPLGLGELLKPPLYGLPVDWFGFGLFTSLVALFALVTTLMLRRVVFVRADAN